MKRIVCAMIAGLALLATTPAWSADDPDFLAIGAGWYDWNREKDETAELRLEYRSDQKWWIFKPFGALGATLDGSLFAGAGVLVDVYFGRRFVLTPSFAPHLYHKGNSKVDLDYPLEFRSQIEAAYRFDDRSRIGIAVSHYSNAGLGKHNPGTEVATVYYEIPLSKLRSLVGD